MKQYGGVAVILLVHTHTHTHTPYTNDSTQSQRGRVAKVAVYFSTVATQQSLSTRGFSTPLPHTHSWHSVSVKCRTRVVIRFHNNELQMQRYKTHTISSFRPVCYRNMETTTAATKKGSKHRSPRVSNSTSWMGDYEHLPADVLTMRTGSEFINGRDGPVIRKHTLDDYKAWNQHSCSNHIK
jgi:hypothetical protein